MDIYGLICEPWEEFEAQEETGREMTGFLDHLPKN